MSILVGPDTRLLVQGLGRDGSFQANRTRAYGTDMVAAVRDGKELVTKQVGAAAGKRTQVALDITVETAPEKEVFVPPPAEAAAMNSYLDEVAQAVAREPVVKLRDLDVAAWQAKGGFSDEEIRQLLEVDDHRHDK